MIYTWDYKGGREDRTGVLPTAGPCRTYCIWTIQYINIYIQRERFRNGVKETDFVTKREIQRKREIFRNSDRFRVRG